MKRIASLIVLLLAPLQVSVAAARMSGQNDRTQVLRGIVVAAGEKAGDVTCIGCSVRILGELGGDVTVFGDQVVVDGAVAGDIVVIGGGIHLLSNAKVAGDALALGGRVTVAPGATLTGERFSGPGFFLPGQHAPMLKGMLILGGTQIGLLFLCGLFLRHHGTESIAEAVRSRWLACLLTGLVMWIIYLALAWLSFRLPGRVLGPAEILLLLIFLLTTVAGMVGICSAIATLFKSTPGAPGGVLAGALAVTLLEFSPLAGCAVFVLMLVFGAGGAIVGRFGRHGHPIQPSGGAVPSEAGR